MAEKKIVKICNNCNNNHNGVCAYIRNNFLAMTRVFDKDKDVTVGLTTKTCITITDAAAKEFSCNHWEARPVKESEDK